MSGLAAQAEELDVSEDEKETFAQRGRAPEAVFSSTLSEPLDWQNTTLVSTGAAEAVRAMEAEATRPLVLSGSLSLGHSLMRVALVDRFRVVLFPVITGRASLERVWEQFEHFSLELLAARTFEGGLQLLEYAPAHLERPPGTAWDRSAADEGRPRRPPQRRSHLLGLSAHSRRPALVRAPSAAAAALS